MLLTKSNQIIKLSKKPFNFADSKDFFQKHYILCSSHNNVISDAQSSRFTLPFVRCVTSTSLPLEVPGLFWYRATRNHSSQCFQCESTLKKAKFCPENVKNPVLPTLLSLQCSKSNQFSQFHLSWKVNHCINMVCQEYVLHSTGEIISH